MQITHAVRSLRCSAWLGAADETTAIVCAWCPDKTTAEQIAAGAGMSCTHGICRPCKDKLLAEFLPLTAAA